MADEILAQVKATLMSGVASWRDIQTNGTPLREYAGKARVAVNEITGSAGEQIDSVTKEVEATTRSVDQASRPLQSALVQLNETRQKHPELLVGGSVGTCSLLGFLLSGFKIKGLLKYGVKSSILFGGGVYGLQWWEGKFN